MKIISQKEQVYEFFVDEYELDGLYGAWKDRTPGLVVCYLLCGSLELSAWLLTLEGEADIGEEKAVLQYSAPEFQREFPGLPAFLEKCGGCGIQSWKVSGIYRSSEVVITGEAAAERVGISYPAAEPVNVIPLLYAAEKGSYEFHAYDSLLMEKVKAQFGLDQKAAVRMLDRMSGYADIWKEFTEGMRGTSCEFPQEGAVEEQGFTAERLCREYPLTPLGAYNYLIYLREEPQAAKQDLEKGLPRGMNK